MVLTIIVEQNDITGELSASISPEVGDLQTFRKPDGNQCLIWDQPDRTGKDRYTAALKKQKARPRLRGI